MARFNSSLISNTITGTTSVGSPFNGSFTALTGTAPYTVTLANPTLFPGINQQFYNGTGGTVTLSTPAGNFVGAGGSAASTFPVYAGNVVSITADGTNYIVISEDGSALTATSATISGVLTVQSSGGVAIAPSTTGTIDNVNVGATTRGSGAFNTLTSNNAVTFTANTASSTTGTGTVVITGGLGVSGAINATSVSASLTGTIQTASQPNITSVGSLTSLTVSGFTGLGAAPAHTTGVQWQGFTGALELNGGVGSIGATVNGLYLQGNQFWDGSVGWSAHALGASSQMLLGKGSIGANVYASANANAAVGSSLASWNLSNTGFSTTGGNLIHSSANPSAGVNLYIKNTTDTGGDNTRYAGIQFQIGSDVGTAAIQAYRTASAADYSTALTFLTKGNGAPATNPVERMRVNALGQVLIGTTSTPYSGATGTGVYINGVSNNQPDLAALFVAGAKIGFAGIQSLIQNQLVVYDNTAGNPVGSGGAIAFGGNAGGGQGTYYAAIESRKDNGTAGAYGASLNFYTRPDSGYYTSPNMTISSSGNIYTPTGSAISYGDGTTYIVWVDEPEVSVLHTSADSSYKNMKTFVASKSGSFKLKFSAYIQSGSKYWGWRIYKNGSTVSAGPYAFSGGLDTGQTVSVHGYTRFAVTISNVTPGDSFVLQMVSTAGAEVPTTGSNQLLYAKEFRIYSTTPLVDHGGASHVWGAQVGVGTTSPQNKFQVNGSLSSYNESSNAGAIATSYSEIVTTPINLGASVGVDVGTISVTTDTCWKAVVRGTFSNNYDGGGLVPPAFYIELNSVQNTIPCGGTSITVARNASTNKLRFTNTSGTYTVAFTGTVEIIVNTQSGQSSRSITTIGAVGVGTNAPAAQLHVLNTGGSTNSPNTALILDYQSNSTALTGAGTAIEFRGKSSGGNIANYSQARIRSTSQDTNNAHGIAFDYKPNAATALTEAMNIDAGGQLNLNGAVNQTGVRTRSGTFSLPSNSGTVITVSVSNYSYVHFKFYALRTNGGNSMAYWDGIINNNNNTTYANAIAQSSGAGAVNFTVFSAPGYTTFTFNFNGSGGYGYYICEDMSSMGSISVAYP